MKKAFTLIELLIVMTVIAILAGILIPSFRGYQSEAWLVKAEGDIGALQIAVESYFRNHDNKYPDTLEDLLTSNPRYIPQLPKDPFRTATNRYGYEVVTKKPGSEPYYVIYSNGPNHVKNWSWNATKGEVVMDKDSDDILFTNAIIQ
ncbi:MAG: type II secretion system protein [Candidatus Margulisbacteria bacterium]|nr:type II secretion system protein [Candidatus Margulisiibacteriota bacterium]